MTAPLWSPYMYMETRCPLQGFFLAAGAVQYGESYLSGLVYCVLAAHLLLVAQYRILSNASDQRFVLYHALHPQASYKCYIALASTFARCHCAAKSLEVLLESASRVQDR
jgi:hypothetical protein